MDTMEGSEFHIPSPYEGCEVGDKIALEVTGVDDDGVRVKVVEEVEPETAIVDDPGLAESFEG